MRHLLGVLLIGLMLGCGRPVDGPVVHRTYRERNGALESAPVVMIATVKKVSALEVTERSDWGKQYPIQHYLAEIRVLECWKGDCNDRKEVELDYFGPPLSGGWVGPPPMLLNADVTYLIFARVGHRSGDFRTVGDYAAYAFSVGWSRYRPPDLTVTSADRRLAMRLASLVAQDVVSGTDLLWLAQRLLGRPQMAQVLYEQSLHGEAEARMASCHFLLVFFTGYSSCAASAFPRDNQDAERDWRGAVAQEVKAMASLRAGRRLRTTSNWRLLNDWLSDGSEEEHRGEVEMLALSPDAELRKLAEVERARMVMR